MIIQILKIVIVFGFLPMACGHCLAQACGLYLEKKCSAFAFRYLVGHFVLWTAFQLLAIPFVGKEKSLTDLTNAWIILLIVVSAIFLLVGKMRNGYLFIDYKSKWRGCQFRQRLLWNKPETWYKIVLFLLAFAVISWQCYKYVFYAYMNMDDATYIAYATDSWETNSLYRINPHTGESFVVMFGNIRTKDLASPWPLFFALLSQLTGFHPAIIAHSIIPVFLLLSAYSAYYLTAEILFPEKVQHRALFVLIVSIFMMFFGGTTRTQGTATLMRIWQGKAVVAAVLLPTVLFLVLKLQQSDERDRYGVYGVLFTVAFGGCLLSGVGIVTVPVLLIVYGGWRVVNTRKWKEVWPLACCLMPEMIYGLFNLFLAL